MGLRNVFLCFAHFGYESKAAVSEADGKTVVECLAYGEVYICGTLVELQKFLRGGRGKVPFVNDFIVRNTIA